MKYNLILIFFLLFQYSFGQFDNANKNAEWKILNAKNQNIYLRVDKDERSNIHLPYDTIEFKDLRYDTSFIAIVFPLFRISNTYNIKLNLDNGFANGISNYMNDFYSISNKNRGVKLVCFIKRFSITLQYDILKHFNANDFQSNASNQVNIEIECYYQHEDTLFPAARFDTAYEQSFGLINNASADIKEILDPFMKKIEQIKIDHVIKRKNYKTEEITKRYTTRFDVPVLKDSIYKKGIYKTFNEFRNNAPAIDSFKLSSEKIKVSAGNQNFTDETSLILRTIQKRTTAIFLYDKNDQLISPSEIFGFCDGRNLWIQHGSFYYQLIKTGNAFEFMYVYHLADNNNRTYTYYILMPLNMDTGMSN